MKHQATKNSPPPTTNGRGEVTQSKTIPSFFSTTHIPTHVSRETPTVLKHDKTTHPTTKATRSQPTKPQQPPQTNHDVSRETSPNTQPTTTQKPYSEAHTKGSTASKSSKSSHTSKLIQPLEKSIHANRRQTGKNTSSVLLFLTSKK